MTPFLKDLAETFYNLHGEDLKDFCFVTPNKRSGTFLKNYFDNAFRKGEADLFVMPEIVTITDFVAGLSEMVVNTRIDCLFSLYKIYSSYENVDVDFDRFRIWGEIALNDFNDVEMFCADADKLFSNLKALNEIGTDYLTDEQREIVEQYFPKAYLRSNKESFWNHFNNQKGASKKFVQLWEIMAPLFNGLKTKLAERNLCLSGTAYRAALHRIESLDEKVLQFKQVIFVGFNALTTVEYRIFKAIRKIRVELNGKMQSMGDYYWDCAGQILAGDNPSAHFMKKNLKLFPSKNKLAKSSNTTGFPKCTKIIACPGNTLQTKVVSGILDKIHRQDPSQLSKPEGTAIAMPDENLFFPILYSLPTCVSEANITMGYPLKMTSTFSWMRHLRTLHSHSRMELGSPLFLRQELTAFFSHPISRWLLGGRVCQWLNECMRSRNTFTINAKEVIEFMECGNIEDGGKRERKREYVDRWKRPTTDNAIKLILEPIAQLAEPQKVCRHLINICELLIESLSKPKESGEVSTVNAALEIENVLTYLDAVNRFLDSVVFHKINMSHISVFALINRLLASERITLAGEPLSGVQIMGMLETRSLDFENVILTSMNERIFPRRIRNRSFIPNSLRKDFGMATSRFQESIYAYYFYRMISRAKNVYLLYDSCSGGLRSGDPSRYIYQLRYLYPEKAAIQNQTISVSVVIGKKKEILGEKTPEVMEKLRQYLDPNSGKRLSASALKKYFNCPLQFYFRYIKNVRVKQERIETMTAIQIGDIFHHTMEELYKELLEERGAPAKVTREDIEGWLRPDETGMTKAGYKLRAKILTEYMRIPEEELHGINLEGYAEVYFRPLYLYVKNTLEADLKKTPFEYVSAEKKEIVAFPLDDGRKVMMQFIIDRIDITDGQLRLVDYKTGGDETEFGKIPSIFKDRQAIMQLFLYASLYDIMTGNKEPIKLCLAKPANLGFTTENYDIGHRVRGKSPEVVDNHLVFKDEFETCLREALKELFNPDIPFRQTSGNSGRHSQCDYCDYQNLCSLREPADVLKNTD